MVARTNGNDTFWSALRGSKETDRPMTSQDLKEAKMLNGVAREALERPDHGEGRHDGVVDVEEEDICVWIASVVRDGASGLSRCAR